MVICSIKMGETLRCVNNETFFTDRARCLISLEHYITAADISKIIFIVDIYLSLPLKDQHDLSLLSLKLSQVFKGHFQDNSVHKGTDLMSYKIQWYGRCAIPLIWYGGLITRKRSDSNLGMMNWYFKYDNAINANVQVSWTKITRSLEICVCPLTIIIL